MTKCASCYVSTFEARPVRLENMDSLFDLLSNRNVDEPPEIRVIKAYVREHFKETVGVMVRERDIVITVRSSALAGTLRTRTYDIAKLTGSDKRLIFRIGTAAG